jgi:glycine dehydrogenase
LAALPGFSRTSTPLELTPITSDEPRPGSSTPKVAPEQLDVSGVSDHDDFLRRHIGPGPAETAEMLKAIGLRSLEELAVAVVPSAIRVADPLPLPGPRGEHELLQELRAIAGKNRVFRSYIGMGYSGCITPPVIQRNILENPGWYTQYTPYQSEISQGRLEALITFQTMVADLTGLPLANASLLDESTAAAEAMAMCAAVVGEDKKRFVVSNSAHPQTIAVMQTRARGIGVDLVVDDPRTADLENACGVLLQYPDTDGAVIAWDDVVKRTHEAGALAVVATDLLALTLFRAPGEFDADIVVGSSQRFGVPLGFGGPHAAFLATREKLARKMPGRLIGVSRDAQGRSVYRMAVQAREQHIRRERATSNICTAQVLLAIMAAMYAVYHGPDGLRRIALRVHGLAQALARGLRALGHDVGATQYFDTLRVRLGANDADAVIEAAESRSINFRRHADGAVGIALDETTGADDIVDILECFREGPGSGPLPIDELLTEEPIEIDTRLARKTTYLEHPVFNRYRSETEMLRYLNRLQSRDLSLATSMIPLGSCTMKLNATSEMLPVTWPAFGQLHPFAPEQQTRGYAQLFEQLEGWIGRITGFEAVSLQPNAGSQGEYAGLLVIRAFHEQQGEQGRDVCLIPVSAHGTNPASAVIAGFRVVPVACDERGDIDLEDLKDKARTHADSLGALMLTYPSTHGVFEESVQEVCRIVHEHGGQVYMDGANLNAMVGLCRPVDIGADVCHLNLHKTFCIPHGGGGPGMGPIAVAAHLSSFLPTHPVRPPTPVGAHAVGAVSAAPYGSPSILPISWMYIALMGGTGLTRATEVAILNANYMASRLSEDYDILYTGRNGLVAHEFIIDCRSFDKSAGVKIDDIAKRLMDYGFHAPTMSWPVPGTLMIEPTESESKAELDRFCDALIAIRAEIRHIEEGGGDREDNPLRNAPHTADTVIADDWTHPYSREQAAFPAPWLRQHKFWPPVSRIDNPHGDRNLFCTCPPME